MASKINEKINAAFGSNKNWFLEPKWAQNGAKMETKIKDFRGHFGLPSEDASKAAKWRPMSSKMEPKWSPKGAKWSSKRAKME